MYLLTRIWGSFAARVFVCLLAVMSVLVLLLSAFFIHSRQEAITAGMIKEGRTITGLLADNVRLGVFSEYPDLLAGPVEAVLSQDNVLEVVIFDEAGNSLRADCRDHPGKNEACGETARGVRSDLETEIRRGRNVLHQRNDDHLVFVAPVLTAAGLSDKLYFHGDDSVPLERQILGFAAVTFTTRGLEKTLYHALVEGVLVTVGFLLLVFLATYFIVQSASRPLTGLVEQVRASGVRVETPDEIGLLHESFSAMIDQLSGAFSTITRLKRELEELTSELLKTQENERQRLAFDLHDNVAQELSSLNIFCGNMARQWPEAPPPVAEELAMMTASLKRCIDTVRALSYDLQPPGLGQLGLAKTVRQLCGDFAKATGLTVDYLATGFDNFEPDYNVAINCYRIIQEALNNVKHHARADRVEVRLIESFPKIILRIKDDGVGFEVEARKDEAIAERRMGLKNMEKRATLLKGSMAIESRVGKGTRILVELPYVERVDEQTTSGKNNTDR
ncbi:MAG: histidine kinase [Thermodesulfobacteriota bacterium]